MKPITDKEVKYNYHEDQLSRIDTKSEFAPTLKIISGEGPGQTKWMDIRPESAKIFVKWLTDNYLPESVNERQSLIDSNRELLEIVKECFYYFDNEQNYPEGTGGYAIFQRAKTALNNAKNLQK